MGEECQGRGGESEKRDKASKEEGRERSQEDMVEKVRMPTADNSKHLY